MVFSIYCIYGVTALQGTYNHWLNDNPLFFYLVQIFLADICFRAAVVIIVG